MKPSGIASTTADLHMIFTPNSEAGESYDVYKIPVEKLKEMVGTCRVVAGGYERRCKVYLLPLRDAV